MTPVFVLLAALVVAGAVAAVAAGSPRLAVLGLFVALVSSAYVAEPFPGPVGLGARLAGTTLGALLVWITLRGAPADVPASANGWLGSAAIAIAAAAAGWLAADTLGTSLTGGGGLASALIGGSLVPRAATGAAFALVALAVPQIALARDTLRLGVALLLLVGAAGLLANAFSGSLTDVEELAIALLTAFGGAGAAAVIAASLRRGGDLDLRDSLRPDAAIRHRAADDAHRGQVD